MTFNQKLQGQKLKMDNRTRFIDDSIIGITDRYLKVTLINLFNNGEKLTIPSIYTEN